MTSPIPFPAYVIGLMSGTSADGVDAALLYTDGQGVAEAQESLFVPYSDALRRDILALMRGVGDAAAIAHALTQVHCEAVEALLRKSGAQVALVGFHGQTIRHAPHEGITVQIGDAAGMAMRLGIPVVADFRSNDVAHGGQGAPLVPLYHAGLAHTLPKPLMVVNIGGVSNVTWIGAEGILAFDSGPGNALLDDWVHQHTGARYDTDGALAARGVVDDAAVQAFLADPFFALPAPKSLDRLHFASVSLSTGVIPANAGISAQRHSVLLPGGPGIRRDDAYVANGAATLTAMTAAAIAQACAIVPLRPAQLLITGGGRHNPTLMRMLAQYSGCAVLPVESVGWDGDMLEAQAFAYLAARSVLGLPLSVPRTTGVTQPVSGGVLFRP